MPFILKDNPQNTSACPRIKFVGGCNVGGITKITKNLHVMVVRCGIIKLFI
jgi:hypothetical protein